MALPLSKAQRVLIWVVTTVVGVALGTFSDPLIVEATRSDIAGALILSPLLVTMMGGVGAPFAWVPGLWVIGLCFWPLFFWLSWQWIQNAARWAWLAVGGLTSIAYFGIVTKFFAAMSV